MSLEQLGIDVDDEALDAYTLAIAMVAMGLQAGLREEPDNPALVPLARNLISGFLAYHFNCDRTVANRMADVLMETLLKEMDL